MAFLWGFGFLGFFFPSFLLQSKWARRLLWEGEEKTWLFFSQPSPTKGRGESRACRRLGGSGDVVVGGRW